MGDLDRIVNVSVTKQTAAVSRVGFGVPMLMSTEAEVDSKFVGNAKIYTGIDELGTRALFDLTRWGFKGVATGISYDMWWNGGNRNVPVRHNIVGILTEAASARLAMP